VGNPSQASGHIFVLIGPSGSGKTTFAEKAAAEGLARRVVTCTTRPPRPGERHGVDYYFLSHAEFDACDRAGGLLEREAIHGHWYGTPRDEFGHALDRGEVVVVSMGYEGARRVKALWPQRVTVVYIQPPSSAALRSRLLARGTPEGEVDRRLAQVEQELQRAGEGGRL
jgi:guanylate kinase